ncbi:hypothetical protein VTK26DRAFT_8433 [Humicola hyalothermophila]
MATADQIIASLKGLNADSFADEVERVRLRDALFEAFRKTQSPWDIAWEHIWVNPATAAAAQTLIDAGVFKRWAEAGGEPITCARLAELTGADVELIRRLMRALAGQCLVNETAEDTYGRTAWAKAVAEDPPFPGMYNAFYHDLNIPLFTTLPAYLRSIGFRNPTDVNDGNFQHWHGAGTNFFNYIGTHKQLAADFNDTMECHGKYNLTSWVDIYPTETIIAAAAADETARGRPLVVDVGGGKGHDLRKFLSRHPDVPAGSLVLQDLPDILRSAEAELGAWAASSASSSSTSSAITVQPHDFFQPQPVRGARVYFMHAVLHDWPDDKARQILRALAPAMEKGYSRLLIHESLVSSVRPLSRVTISDLTMMACLSAAERSEDQWRALIESVGMRVLKIWRPVQSMESIIEVEVV